MRTYQFIRATDGVSAVGNSLVVGTAFIWVPLLAIYIGYQLLAKTFEFGDFSPKVIAAQKAKSDAEKLAAYQRKARVERDANGKPIWTSTENAAEPVANVLPVSNPHRPKLTWEVSGGGVRYILTDTPCTTYQQRAAVYKWDSYWFKTSANSSGCYAVRNGVIGLGVGADRVVFFDVKDAGEIELVEQPKVKSKASSSTSAADRQAREIAAAVKHAKEVAAIYSQKYAAK